MNKLTKECPFCGEKIKAIAIKCKHCGSDLSMQSHPVSYDGMTTIAGLLSSRFEVLEKIGSGGMATVYRAKQKNLEREVALKVFHKNLITEKSKFIQEGIMNAAVVHPNIVLIYDLDELNGVHYISMELLQGRDLLSIIREKGKLDVNQTLHWLIPIAKALHNIHSKGVIHRDVKPGNIMICKESQGELNRPVLTDFGIALGSKAMELTREGVIEGTPHYMSPEQVENKIITDKSDVYSLGVVMYECLTGRVPFSGSEIFEIMNKIVNEIPTPPIELNPEIPEWINTIIIKALSKDPHDRFQTAQDLAVAMEKGGDDEANKTNDDNKKVDTINRSEKTPKQFQISLKTSRYFLAFMLIIFTLLMSVWLFQQEIRLLLYQDDFMDQMVLIEANTKNIPDATLSTPKDFVLPDKSFYLSKYEVTQKQFEDIMGYNPSHFKGCPDCPVENISWSDAFMFIDKLNTITGKNYRLPTTDEWLLASLKGGSSNEGWLKENSGLRTKPVGIIKPNDIGISDMLGNVWEMCNSKPDSANSHLRFIRIRGAGFATSKQNVSAYPEKSLSQERRHYEIGFRIAEDLIAESNSTK